MMLGLLAAIMAAAPWDAPLTLHGIGSLRVGMPVAALRRMGARGEAYPDPDTRRVLQFRVGTWEAVRLIEGCS